MLVGRVERRRGVPGEGGTILVVPSLAVSSAEKVKTRADLGSADNGGVAVMVLGNWTSLTIAGDMGCAVSGVSRYGPRYGV
jgi:hypothetical protein